MLAVGVLGLRAPAQETEGKAKPQAAVAAIVVPPAAAEAGAADADGPDIFLLPDESGKLRRVLGYRYEDFFKAWQADGAADEVARPPQFVMSSIAVEADAGADSAKAMITIDVELQSDQWVNVPLALGSLIVDDSKIEDGSTRDFVTFDAPRGNYVAWFKGKPGERRTIVLEGQLVVARDGEGRRLTVELPAAAESSITLVAPGAVKVESPATALVASQAADGGHTRSRIEGVKGPLALSWGQPAGERRRSTAFEAVTDAVVNVEQGRLAYEAFITVRGFNSPVERVRVRLPPGASPSGLNAGTGYEVTPVAAASAGDSASVVEVRFLEPTARPPVIRLTAEQSAAAARATVLRAGAFEVLGAFRQRGHAAIRVSDQLHAHFESEGRVTQMEPTALPDVLLTQQPLAAFETSGAAWAVEVHTQPRQRKVSVTPDYDMHLGSQGAALDMALDYQISGGRVFELRVDLRGWELTEQPIESGGAVDLAEQHVTEEQILIMPLKDSDAQQARLRLSLRREAGLGVHDLPLPEAQDAFALPGELTVTCDEAWRATAQIENSVGVSLVDVVENPLAESGLPSGVGAGVGLGAARRDAAALRLQTFLPQARLMVDVSAREQAIAVKSIVEARVDAASIESRQWLEYDILYQPASELAATVSAELLANEGLELLLDGKPLPSSALDVQPLSSADDASSDLRVVVRLPQPTVGRARLEIRSHQSLTPAQLAGTAGIFLPLAMPDQPATTQATVASAKGSLKVALANGGASPWAVSNAAASAGDVANGDAPELRAEATRPARELALRLEPAGTTSPVETRIEAAWVQTWVAGGTRQDRLAYRFHTSGPRVVLAMPAGFDEVEVLLDGQVVSADRTRPGTLAVELPADERDRLYTLELRRHTPLHISTWGQQSVAFPRIVGADPWSPFFWQLVLPPELSAVRTPTGMSAEYQLGWQGLRWGREPTQSQRDLERWTAASSGPTPSPRTNQYLYSAFQPPESAEFVAVRRVWMVVAAGLAALAVGLAWLYTQVARSAAFWLALCIGAAGLLFIYPETVIVMVQAIVLGGAFTLISVVTQWLLSGVRPRMAAPPTAASSVASLTATQPWIAEPGGADGSVATAASEPSIHASGSVR